MFDRIKSASPKAIAVVGAVAIVVTLAGGSAVAKALITGGDVRNSSLTGADIKNKSLHLADLDSPDIANLRGRAGATGANGVTGDAGTKGDAGFKGDAGTKGDAGNPGNTGAAGLVGLDTGSTTDVWVGVKDKVQATLKSFSARCAPGKVAIGGGFTTVGDGAKSDESKAATVIISSQPSLVDGVPNGWLVEGYNFNSVDVTVRSHVLCASIAE
jgi:Collagen triple helix repeat (20 copies)